MRIDAHQHFWRLAGRAGEWPPADLEPIHRDIVPAEHGAAVFGANAIAFYRLGA